ncbi:hypothetical protein Tco_0961795 [Tanacetum coccineum]
MSTSTMDHFTYTTNHKYDRSMLLPDIELIFDLILRRCFPKLKETNAFIRPLEGDARKTYGDYVWMPGTTKKVSNLFDQRKPKHFARVKHRFLLLNIMAFEYGNHQ